MPTPLPVFWTASSSTRSHQSGRRPLERLDHPRLDARSRGSRGPGRSAPGWWSPSRPPTRRAGSAAARSVPGVEAASRVISGQAVTSALYPSASSVHPLRSQIVYRRYARSRAVSARPPTRRRGRRRRLAALVESADQALGRPPRRSAACPSPGPSRRRAHRGAGGAPCPRPAATIPAVSSAVHADVLGLREDLGVAVRRRPRGRTARTRRPPSACRRRTRPPARRAPHRAPVDERERGPDASSASRRARGPSRTG